MRFGRDPRSRFLHKSFCFLKKRKKRKQEKSLRIILKDFLSLKITFKIRLESPPAAAIFPLFLSEKRTNTKPKKKDNKNSEKYVSEFLHVNL